MLIGELQGEVSTDRLTFEAYKEVEQFDFVTVKNPKEGQEWILAQIDEVTKHPDGDTICEANVIGFREDGLLKQPRYVVEPGAMVYRADEDVIAETLGLTTSGLYMGRLDTNPDIRIFINPEDLYKHIAVLAKTGAGKSYATGVMIEELLEQDYPVLIIDPHGEYHSLEDANPAIDEEDVQRYDIDATGYPVTEYSTNVNVNPAAEELSFSSDGMDAKEIEQLVPTNLTNSQLEVLYNALKSLKDKDRYDLDDIIDACMNQESKAKWNLVNILEVVQDSNMFTDHPTTLEELIRPGEASIVNLKGVDPERQEMIVYKLAKELFEQRKVGELDPFIMVIEEAHNFVPERNFGKAVSSDILRTIASEGRKFGLGIGIISQRPARVDKNILSQCNTQLILRVTNPNDLNAISRSFEGVTSEVKDYITSLPPGVGLLLGKEYPVMTDIRVRRSRHGGEMKELSEQDETAEEDELMRDATEDADDAVTTPAPGQDAQDRATDADDVKAGDEDAADEEPDEEFVRRDADEHRAIPPDPDVDGADDEERDPEDDASAPDTGDTSDDAIAALHPVLSREKLSEKLGEVDVAYYPLWLVSGATERVAVDGTDGSVKEFKRPYTDLESGILAALDGGEQQLGALVEATDAALQEVEDAVAALETDGLVERDGKTVEDVRRGVFDRDIEQVDVSDATVIEADVDEGEAREIASGTLSDDPEHVELVYYPYFTAGSRVFDAVRAEEV